MDDTVSDGVDVALPLHEGDTVAVEVPVGVAVADPLRVCVPVRLREPECDAPPLQLAEGDALEVDVALAEPVGEDVGGV